ncbi:MAG: hypothetical protein ACTHON_12295 [Humibacter sp.]
MDPTVVALLAAGIPAMVAAGTFVAGEVLKARRARREEFANAVGELVEVLVRLLVIEDRPLIVWRWQVTGSIARVSAAATSFLAVVGKRDRVFAFWVVESTQSLVEGDRFSRVE